NEAQGTIPFMALTLLREYFSNMNQFTHMQAHDLESLIYVLVWVCILYQAPGEIHMDCTINETCLKTWVSVKSLQDIATLRDVKLGQLQSKSVVEDFTPYFQPLKPFMEKLYDLIHSSNRPASDCEPLKHVDIKCIL
ncbi:hypothetical protein BKA83DRAFT_4006779, partial [Pisolithus microcarpus]